jgi:hypothetical protein
VPQTVHDKAYYTGCAFVGPLRKCQYSLKYGYGTIKLNFFNVHGSVHRKNILIYVYIQQDATLHSLFCLETALHVSGGTSTHHQERKQLYLQDLVLVITPLPLSDASGR